MAPKRVIKKFKYFRSVIFKWCAMLKQNPLNYKGRHDRIRRFGAEKKQRKTQLCFPVPGSLKDKNTIKKLKKRVSELEDKHLRLLAEFDNYRKKNLHLGSDAARRAQANIAKDLLDVLDDLERVVSQREEPVDLKAIDMVYHNLHRLLKNLKVEEIGTDKFDPQFHEVIQVIEGEEKEDVISDVLRKGYTLKNVLLRPASVVISKKRQKKDREICTVCGKKVSPGTSGFVNRIPDFNDLKTKREMGRKFPEGEYVCAECDSKRNATEGEQMGCVWLKRRVFPSYIQAFGAFRANPGLLFLYHKAKSDPRVHSLFSNYFPECTILKPSCALSERVVGHGTRGCGMFELNAAITRVRMDSGGTRMPPLMSWEKQLLKRTGKYRDPIDYVIGVILRDGTGAVFLKGNLHSNYYVNKEIGGLLLKLRLNAGEKGLGKGWFGESRRHGEVRRVR